ncbi:YbhB/YbcL family Raf kinase inhibitor-like protein [Deinococcus ruber]|uniref:Kinase inhibitor Raf n=1 Tax=Deinococcus ruber TaxID=1848197 RepID=A0A918F4W1_9DEIO|nr:YbhB/YbcL family Raf kinase inhibitor-like protein [Deinococcus ruber]GGR01152.1 kinase inhibitor Raf [Deinococcus ruber]
MKNALQGVLIVGGLLLAGCAPSMGSGMMGMSMDRLSVAQPAAGVGANGLTLSSPQFSDGGTLAAEQVGSGNGCTGQNVSPALSWSGAPAGTVSYVLTTYDPDAPTGSGFWHWVTYNIPASATGLDKGAGSGGATPPAGTVLSNNDGGQSGYTGPCPPPGDKPHRYVFTLYALNKTLTLPPNASPAYVGFNLNGATLAKTSISGYYGR